MWRWEYSLILCHIMLEITLSIITLNKLILSRISTWLVLWILVNAINFPTNNPFLFRCYDILFIAGHFDSSCRWHFYAREKKNILRLHFSNLSSIKCFPLEFDIVFAQREIFWSGKLECVFFFPFNEKNFCLHTQQMLLEKMNKIGMGEWIFNSIQHSNDMNF